MQAAFSWFWYVITSCVDKFNFTIPLWGNLANVGFLDFLVVTFLLALVVRNFVHMAR